MKIEKFSSDEFNSFILKDWGTGKVWGSAEACKITGRKLSVLEGSLVGCGIWEASIGYFVREVNHGEFMQILKGHCVFKPDAGDEVDIVAGDFIFFPPNTKGVWHIMESVRKFYIMFDQSKY